MNAILPQLKTALSEPIHTLEKQLLDNKNDIEIWLRRAFDLTQPPFYSSVDIRNAGYKLAPVDTNLFPAGFNNIHPELKTLGINAIKVAISKTCPDTDGVIIVPENHTRSQKYFEHLKVLEGLVKMAGYPVKIMSINPSITTAEKFALANGEELIINPLQKKNDFLVLDDMTPCAVILNNDLSSGLPDELRGLKQNIIPHTSMGWFNRTKSNHFKHYKNIAESFCNEFGLDVWCLVPDFQTVRIKPKQSVDWSELEHTVDEMLTKLQDKYNQHGISQKPFVAIKSNNGTYGMGIIMVDSSKNSLALNRKQRKKLSYNKGGLEISEIIVQEGVYAVEEIGGATAEPVVYMIDQFIVGSFYRLHQNKSVTDNLNAPGMAFDPLPIENPCPQSPSKEGEKHVNRFYAYSVVARLANLAAAYEMEDYCG